VSRAPVRLAAPERRRALIEAGLRVFCRGSYGGATTAQIAREAGISEPILYRHFASKRDLYLACLDEAWERLREAFEARISELGEAEAVRAIGQTVVAHRAATARGPTLWIRALTEAGGDTEIRRYLRRHLRDVHDYVAGVVRRAQAAGGVPPDRDPDAEAWIFIGGGLLISVADRLGGLLDDDGLAGVAAARLRWLTGSG
jgi:TetR/AcrR family transcriptional regulator